MDETPEATDAAPEDLLRQRVRKAIADWTAQLIDVSGRNTLPCYRSLKAGTIDLRPSAVREAALQQLLEGGDVRLSEAFEAGDLPSMARRLRTIGARAQENFEERGLKTLWLAWGMVTWTNSRTAFTPCAPLLLCQAKFEARGGAGEDFNVSLSGDWEINPTLVHVLNTDFAVALEPEALLEVFEDQNGGLHSGDLFERVSKQAHDVPGLAIDDRIVIANFSYARLPIVKDLAAGEDLIISSALICAIAGDEDARQILRARHGDVSPSEPDTMPPADEFVVVDADSSQSYAINAVLAGVDLVIDGPPGTGKSQTIANLIATLSARGKRVLFVAEKRAAIDAVVNRLEKVGMSDLVLDMHEGPGAKGKLAQTLAKALADASAALPTDMTGEQERLVQSRNALVRRTAALHAPRLPWGVSVLGIQAQLMGIAAGARSSQRLPADTLNNLGAQQFRQAEGELDRYVGLGGFDLLAGNSSWSAAFKAGTITTAAQAGQALDTLTQFSQVTLRTALSQMRAESASVGLSSPEVVAEWAGLFLLLGRVERSLAVFHPAVYEVAFDELLLALAPATRSAPARLWKKIFSRAYPKALRAVRELLVEQGVRERDLYAALTEASATAVAWSPLSVDGQAPRVPEHLSDVEAAYGRFVSDLHEIGLAVGRSDLATLTGDQVAAAVTGFLQDRTMLFKLPELWELYQRLSGAGLGPLVEEMRLRQLRPDQAAACLRFVWLASILDRVSLTDREIGTFDGDNQTRTVLDYRDRDRRHIGATPERIRRAVAENVTAARDTYPEESELVTHEAGKRRRHIPVRSLFQQAPHVLSALKPCWAMSPLVVSQMLPLERNFDVVVFDEASQVTPESAVGALMRAERAVVAGDPHQLPPTAFFASSAPNEDGPADQDDEVDTSMTKDFESILDVFGALLPPPKGTKRLNWHYRSRDERLIAFSNAQPSLYSGSLVTFPGSQTDGVITHVLVPFVLGRIDQQDSVSDEVVAVVQAVSDHARDRPDESLGVITMGIKHAERVQESLRRARQGDAVLDGFMDRVHHVNERFFVKNLERVQGDERDAIIISIGYGKSAEGRMLYRFGPLNNAGGERRLNVAVTRARDRVRLISSFSSNDLESDHLRAEGARMLRDYLAYAESGGTDLGTTVRDRDPLNPFEQDVLTQLTASGLSLESQLGCSGYWIDFAARHPDEPGRYVLAIEADGSAYHSSATARDRDRLRQDHLERLGWRFHRIWSTEWFHHRESEVAKAVAAFNQALAEDRVAGAQAEALATPAPPSVPPLVSISRPVRPEVGGGIPIDQYTPQQLQALIRWIDSDRRLRTHEELVVRAISELGYHRRGSRIVDALTEAIIAVRRGT